MDNVGQDKGPALKASRAREGFSESAIARKWPCSEENIRQLERRANVRPATVMRYMAILGELGEERAAAAPMAAARVTLLEVGRALIAQAEAMGATR